MFVVLNQGLADAAGPEGWPLERIEPERDDEATSECIEVGLVNNMPDAALRATERQFINLLAAAAGERIVRLHFFALAGIPRGEAERSHLRAAYAGMEELKATKLDALIVTGCEPRAERLSDEPYWSGLTEIVDWAEHNTVSTIWSCLAAHAAVLHLDGIERRRLPQKRSGVFDCEAASGDPLLAGLRSPLHIAHSRWNDLPESALVAHGYNIVTRSAAAGVDIFTKRWQSLFVFFQGHPEYSADALMREYRRDVGRFLRGEADRYPVTPAGYFDRWMEAELAAFGAAALAGRDPCLIEHFPADQILRSRLIRPELSSGVPVIANWLSYLASQKR